MPPQSHFGEEERLRFDEGNGRWQEFLECEENGRELPMFPKNWGEEEYGRHKGSEGKAEKTVI